MKKALLVMNGTFVSQHLMGSSVALAKSCGATLHAWFLIHDSSIGDMDYAFPNDLRLTENVLTGKSIAQEDEELLKANITLFEDACREARVPYVIEAEHYISLRKFLHHTAFADFVIADARATIDQFALSDLLSEARCPILLLSAETRNIQKIFFAYDGSYSSLYAMKQFAALFPEWNNAETHVLYATEAGRKELPSEKELAGWLRLHYPRAHTRLLTGKAPEQLARFMGKDSTDSVVVLGAYGRPGLSRLLHKSLADHLVQQVQAALFVVHQ